MLLFYEFLSSTATAMTTIYYVYISLVYIIVKVKALLHGEDAAGLAKCKGQLGRERWGERGSMADSIAGEREKRKGKVSY